MGTEIAALWCSSLHHPTHLIQSHPLIAYDATPVEDGIILHQSQKRFCFNNCYLLLPFGATVLEPVYDAAVNFTNIIFFDNFKPSQYLSSTSSSSSLFTIMFLSIKFSQYLLKEIPTKFLFALLSNSDFVRGQAVLKPRDIYPSEIRNIL